MQPKTNKQGAAPNDTHQLARSAEMLKAIAHPIRLSIIELLDGGHSLNVTEIFNALGIRQPIASHHINIMREHGVVVGSRAGRNTYYQLTSTELAQLLKVASACTPA